jgi:hypothetical protein
MMLKTIASIFLSAAVALGPIASFAQATQSSAPAASAHAQKPTGSYRSQMRHRSNLSKERARASAENMRHLRTAPKS